MKFSEAIQKARQQVAASLIADSKRRQRAAASIFSGNSEPIRYETGFSEQLSSERVRFRVIRYGAAVSITESCRNGDFVANQ